jgi:hypothetical protein
MVLAARLPGVDRGSSPGRHNHVTEGLKMEQNDDIIIVTGSNGRIGNAAMRRLTEHFKEVVKYDPVFAYTVIIGGGLMGFSFMIQIFYPLYEMWLRHPIPSER